MLYHPHASCPPLQRIPDRQQASFTICPPPVIPESQFLNVLFLQIRAALLVMLHLLRQAMLKTVKLHVQPGSGAIKIQNINPARMLASEFESRKAMAPQRAPEFLFLVCLIAAKLAGDLFEAHSGKMLLVGKNSSPLTPCPLPVWAGRGRSRAQCGATVKIRRSPPTTGWTDFCLPHTVPA